jgi:hypothetical protein
MDKLDKPACAYPVWARIAGWVIAGAAIGFAFFTAAYGHP